MRKQKLINIISTLGIIILLISAIVPLVEAGNNITKGSINKETISIDKYNDMNLLSFQGPSPKLSGTKGNNNWYITNVKLTFLYIPEMVDEIWYKIASGNWQQYNDVAVDITQEGNIPVLYYWIDNGQQQHNESPFTVKIDKTLPTIKLKKSNVGDGVKFTATCDDKTSGLDYVEFYLDDVLQVTDDAKPYEYTWIGPKDEEHSVYAIVFDMAGLEKQSDTLGTPRISFNFFHFIDDIIQKIIYRIWS